MNPLNPDYEQLYRRALEHYARGQIEAALDLLDQLEAGGHATPEARDLAADIRLQQKLTTATVSAREAPAPPRRIGRPLALGLATLATLLLGAGALFWPRPPERAASAPTLASVPTPLLPTATPLPPTATPLLPTATPLLPTATPLAAAAPASPAALADGQLAVLLPEGQAALTRSPSNIAIILDASGSMLASFGEQTKMAVARTAVGAMVEGLPAETRLALRTYGAQRSRDCTDLALLRPLDLHERDALLAEISQVEPAVEGMTPIGASLDALAIDLLGVQGSTAALLVSDGEENCGGDPVASARGLTATNPQLRIHVIGFNIGDDEASARLRTIAEVGRGQYFDANSAADLDAALQEAIQLSYSVFNEEGEPLATGLVGGAPLTLAPGRYRIVLDSDTPSEIFAEVGDGGQTLLRLTPDGEALEPAG